MAHEIGHLLLGSNSHAPAGIMSARWEGQELNRMARGNLLFTDAQSDQMRTEIVCRPFAADSCRAKNFLKAITEAPGCRLRKVISGSCCGCLYRVSLFRSRPRRRFSNCSVSPLGQRICNQSVLAANIWPKCTLISLFES